MQRAVKNHKTPKANNNTCTITKTMYLYYKFRIYVYICKYMPSCSMLTRSSGRSLNAAQRPWQISNLCVKRKITNPTPSTSICNLIFQFPKKSGSRKKKCAPKLRIRYDRISAIVVYCFANCFFLYTSFRATYASIRYELFGAHRSFHLGRGTCLTHRLSNNACRPECTNKPKKKNIFEKKKKKKRKWMFFNNNNKKYIKKKQKLKKCF